MAIPLYGHRHAASVPTLPPQMRRISRNHVGRDSRKKNCEKKNCVWHSPIIGDGVGMLKPISIAHADPVVPAQYFVPYGRM